jgi:hypothetical protein
MIKFMQRYGKSFVSVGAALGGAVVAAMTGDNRIDASEWLNVIILTCGAAAVFTAPNVPGARYTKLVLAVITAVATGSVSLVVNGISWTDAMQMGVAAFGALGVQFAPHVSGVSDTAEQAPQPAMAAATG